MKKDATDHLVRQMERLLFARRAFFGAAKAAEFLVRNMKHIDGEIYHPLSAGLIVSYARPFMDSDLGMLAPKYQRFPEEPILEALHKDVMKARHSLYAHFSPTEALGLRPAGTKTGKHGTLTFKENKIVGILMPVTSWSPDRLQAFHSLCAFQCKRTLADAKVLIDRLKGTDSFPDGEYDIGTTFPKPR